MNSTPSPPFLRSRSSSGIQLLAVVAVVFGVGASFVVLGATTEARDFLLLGGLAALVVLAFLSGNPRVFSIWGFGLTISLNLSKRFGPMNLGKPGGEDSFRVEASDVFLGVLLGFLIWELVSGRRKWLRIPRYLVLWLLLIGIGCVWVAVGEWQTAAAHEVVRMVKVMVMFIVFVNLLDRQVMFWHVSLSLVSGVVLQSLIGLAQWRQRSLFGLEFLGEATASTIDVLEATSVVGAAVFRPSGLLQHTNLLGIFIAMLLPLAIAMLMVCKGPLARAICLGAILVGAPAEIVTLSRSSWVSATISVTLVLLFGLLHPRLRRRSTTMVGLAVLASIVVFGAFFGPITQRLFRSQAAATNAREIYKVDALRAINQAPWVGRGLNSYSLELPEFSSLAMVSYGPAQVSVHHIFYLWWVETGVFGMLIFCVLWGAIIWVGIGNLQTRNEFYFIINAAALAAAIALIPDGFLSFTLRVNSTLRVFWILAALMSAIRYLRLTERSTPQPETREHKSAEYA